MTSLVLTGERTMPGVPGENYWFRRHEAAYLLLRPQLIGPRLLEVGAGEGYGTALLAEQVSSICAIDYDPAVVAHLARTYPGVAAARANLAALPFADGSFDTLISLQVIEHVWDHPQFVVECRRVLRPGGLLLISTPNRLTFSPGLDKPVNPFHTHEFTAAELVRLVSGCGFESVAVAGLHAGSRLVELDSRHEGGLVTSQLARPVPEWSDQLTADVDSITTADFSLSEVDVDAALDLVVSARA